MGWGDLTAGPVLKVAGDAALVGIDDLAWAWADGGWVLYASTGAGGALSAWSLGPGGALAALDRAGLPSGATAGIGGELVLVDAPGSSGPMVATTGVGGAGLWGVWADADGALGSRAALTASGGALPADLSGALSLEVGSTTYLYGLRLGSGQVSAWSVGADGTLRTLSDPAPAAPAPAGAGLTDLAAVERDGQAFLVAASGTDDALVCFRLGADGVPVEVGRLGAAQGLGIDAPQAVATAVVGGRAYAVMASAGSGSLTVAEVRPDGTLSPADHVIDELGTRFAGASLVAACVVGGRAFVAAAGTDDGVTLFELLPGGRLLLLSSLADSTAATLDGITALALTADGGDLVLAVASGSEPGVTLVTAPLPSGGLLREGTGGADTLEGGGGADRLNGAGGDDSVAGGAGDDVLLDGAGRDRLSGGSGADVFVLAADGEADTVTGFGPGEDRLDLTGWPGLRDPSQIAVTATADGAELRFGAETLRIVTADGRPLSADAVRGLELLGLTRVMPSAADMAALTPRTLTGADGADTLAGAGGADRLSGGGGDDRLQGKDAGDLLYGGEGADLIEGGSGADTAWGGAGGDQLRGDGGNDRLYAEDGDDRAWGGSEDDSLWGAGGRDALYGEAGRDRLQGDDGDDDLYGGDGDDSLRGDAGQDELWSQGGADSLSGGDGNDTLLAGDGADRLDGDAGNDSLSGGAGDDSAWAAAARTGSAATAARTRPGARTATTA